jgi:hypothetical protein
MQKTIKDSHIAMLNQLKDPFDPKFVKWRVGATSEDKKSGIALAYIDSREVKKRLDTVCGLAGWRDRLIPVDGGFISEIDIKIDGEWITRSNAAGNTKVEPIKGGASDAFKRAASKWGIGHYLYYLPNTWVPIKLQGKSYVLVEAPELPVWALPGRVEHWEDVAELESTDDSGADSEVAAMVIENIDNIRGATTEAELDEAVNKLPPDQQLLFANEINVKRRELKQHAKIHSDNSGRTPAIS